MACVAASVKLPQTDTVNNIFNIIFGLPAAQALHVAHELNLFELIDLKKLMSLEEIASALHLELRPAQALLSMCVSLNLIKWNNNCKFELTDISKNYLLKESPLYIGGSLDLTLMNAEVYSFKSFKNALLGNTSQIYEGKELFQTNEQQVQLAKYFTRCMHGKSIAMAGMWPNKVDFSKSNCLLDIGGGSGAHSIGALLRWPHLKAIVYDRPAVVEVAEEYIAQFGLEDRIQAQIGDMWKDEFPVADIHFYCDVFHDWNIEQCKFLIQKSYAELSSKGRIVIHEMLFNENKTGPLSVASYNIMMLLWTQGGQQLSSKEISELLKEGGFVNIRIVSTGFGDWSIIEGEKA